MRKRVITIAIMAAFVVALAAVPAFALTAGSLPNPWPPTQSGLMTNIGCRGNSPYNLCAIFTDMQGGFIMDCAANGIAGYTQYTCTGTGTLTCKPGNKQISTGDTPAIKCTKICGACPGGWGNPQYSRQ